MPAHALTRLPSGATFPRSNGPTTKRTRLAKTPQPGVLGKSFSAALIVVSAKALKESTGLTGFFRMNRILYSQIIL